MTRQPDCIPSDGSDQRPASQGLSAVDWTGFSDDLTTGLQRLKHDTAVHEECGTAAVESAWMDDDSSIDRDRLASLLEDMGDDTAAFRLRHCQEPGLGWIGKCENNPDHKEWQSPFWCEQRVCPTCAKRRSWKLALEILEPIRRVAGKAPEGYELSHVILTTNISLDEDLDYVRSTAKRLRVGVRTMFQAMFEDDENIGGFIGEEFGEEGRKLHYHVLMLSPFIPKRKMSAMWKKWTGGRGEVTWVRAVSDVYSAVAEVVKYCTKPLKAASETQALEVTLSRVAAVIKGRRRIQGFGVFYNMPRDEDDKYDCSCPECGGKIIWRSELSEIRKDVVFRPAPAGVDLIESNNLLPPPRPPPTLTSFDQLLLFDEPVKLAHEYE